MQCRVEDSGPNFGNRTAHDPAHNFQRDQDPDLSRRLDLPLEGCWVALWGEQRIDHQLRALQPTSAHWAFGEQEARWEPIQGLPGQGVLPGGAQALTLRVVHTRGNLVEKWGAVAANAARPCRAMQCRTFQHDASACGTLQRVRPKRMQPAPPKRWSGCGVGCLLARSADLLGQRDLHRFGL
jgi:hypothetical protein